ncbi:ABC transporter ATP-binding protein [Rhizobium sp. SL86]|uniref:ABC transporter ATP-binding protein n=1 Tax=Rhizobium sp. SL86 TaxID=2995148 RepID=UPI002276E7A3|nr:ABC transporter ATP-binding protein [Rhizobium sp. SL86]MCY1667677.1 ABC transporter ATP-binding protein [Rhizobium sp. SL86]
MSHRLAARSVTLCYDSRTVSQDLSVAIPDGAFTVIIGANACGKSTLLRAMSRLLAPRSGLITLDGEQIGRLPAKQVAQKLGLLPQSATAPTGITVAELVARGRYPHQTFFRQWSLADQLAVTNAMQATQVSALSDRMVDELSGGQRQRVWIAMLLAQETPLLLLDEPTTYLDITHQIELLDLLSRLNGEGRTIVAVLHDLNQACRYASHLIAMKEGRIVAEGAPRDIVTEDLVFDILGLKSMIIEDPVSATPLVVPKGQGERSRIGTST